MQWYSICAKEKDRDLERYWQTWVKVSKKVDFGRRELNICDEEFVRTLNTWILHHAAIALSSRRVFLSRRLLPRSGFNWRYSCGVVRALQPFNQSNEVWTSPSSSSYMRMEGRHHCQKTEGGWSTSRISQLFTPWRAYILLGLGQLPASLNDFVWTG